MPDIILINSLPFETRVALLEAGQCGEIFIERDREPGILGNIYKGRVSRVLPGMQSAFIDLGLERTAFLYIREISPKDFSHLEESEELEIEAFEEKEKFPAKIENWLREGQEILVQVIREPIGEKGAQLTTHLTLPGRYLVYMPTSKHLGVSRKIEDEKERARLKNLLRQLKPDSSGGFILRTASQGIDEDQLAKEMHYLINFWKQIQERAKTQPAPSLVFSELPLELRVLREYLSSQTKEIIVDQPEVLTRVRDYLSRFAPQMLERVHLWQESEPLFEKYGVELELDRALEKRVWLKSGGFIIIDETEALTTIDVNTGKYVGKKSFEDTVFKTNLEASREIVSQLRLRNIGGIIIIDFIDMDKPKNRQKVLEALKEELKKDKAKSVVVRISEIGLTEMTRQRSEPSLVKKLCQSCPYCEGKGYIKSPRTICYEIYREIEKNQTELAEKRVKLYVNPMVAELLLGEEKRLVEMLKKEHKIALEVLIRDNFHQEQYELVIEEESETGA